MKNRLVLCLFFLIILLSSCQKNKTSNTIEASIAKDSIQGQTVIRSIGETLSPGAKKKVESWTEYQQLDQLLSSFYSSTHHEVLNLSKELSTTTQRLKDSINIERFKQADIGIRINVIHTIALRLQDLSNIQNSSSSEINNETQRVLDAFSALNSKINNIANQESLEAALRNFND